MIVDFQGVARVGSSQKSHADCHGSFSERQRAPIFAFCFLNQPSNLRFTLEYGRVGQIDCCTRLNEETDHQ